MKTKEKQKKNKKHPNSSPSNQNAKKNKRNKRLRKPCAHHLKFFRRPALPSANVSSAGLLRAFPPACAFALASSRLRFRRSSQSLPSDPPKKFTPENQHLPKFPYQDSKQPRNPSNGQTSQIQIFLFFFCWNACGGVQSKKFLGFPRSGHSPRMSEPSRNPANARRCEATSRERNMASYKHDALTPERICPDVHHY